ncbi:class I SAM-dependent methyltransferase [Silanimonas sp.]|jgi:SAM-dependent methyltransferase|uniref:class I SAM-dependent methyltransferase n=1 Tax=Silanimonas sp. TaxID=1929290 RepID=UPI0022BABE3D|nr:class I SAM-dependent methyltransferase [Silanimonas sp.]MCZ8062369.1 class I SAM-dependent methyltransferase [Silanimonas sp.]
MKSTLPHDGERVVEASYEATSEGRNILAMHLASYSRVLELCSGKDVLDLGCGSGYGIASLAPCSRSAVGVDVSDAAIDYAREHYQSVNLRFSQIFANKPTPFPDESFDVVLSFQVIEHVDDDVAYVSEICRLLRPGGHAVFITPDRRSRLFSFQKPWNRWHLREYSADSLAHIVSSSLSVVALEVMHGEELPVSAEIERYRIARWIALPVTLPFVPEVVRRSGLAFLSYVSTRLQGLRRGIPMPASPRPVFWFEAVDRAGLNVLVFAKKG